MSSMLIICKFCLLALSIQILKINTVSSNVFTEKKIPSASVFPEIKFPSANVFSEIKFPFSFKKFDLKDFFSMFHMSVSHIKSFKSIYLDDLKHSIDDLVSKLYKQINAFIQNPDDLLSHFKLHKISWNWTGWPQDFSRSAFNFSDFNFHIENELFGQHIISYYLPKLLKDHLIKIKPMKPLLISFQGPTGSGKSFVSKLLVESLFQEGFKSKCVHTYYGSRDFFHEKEKETYRKRLLHEVPFLLSLCDKPVIIFEEMDKMVPGVLDVILPFIYFYENSTDAYAAESIFVFISNSGAKKIEEILYDAWLEGVPREDMTLTKFSYCLKAAAYHESGGLQYSEIIKRNLIDMYLPFLPLEKEHVKQCVLREFNLRKIPFNKNTVEFVADQIIYHPPEFELFAESGCKRVSQKVDLFEKFCAIAEDENC